MMLDAEATDEASSALAELRSMCGRALEKLSKDIYAHETHFFSELIQNCDDNKYTEGTVPTLSLLVSNDSVTLLNNEVGFTEADVRSICDLGASTKAADSIGHKGIGFKSVSGRFSSRAVCCSTQLCCAGLHGQYFSAHPVRRVLLQV